MKGRDREWLPLFLEEEVASESDVEGEHPPEITFEMETGKPWSTDLTNPEFTGPT